MPHKYQYWQVHRKTNLSFLRLSSISAHTFSTGSVTTLVGSLFSEHVLNDKDAFPSYCVARLVCVKLHVGLMRNACVCVCVCVCVREREREREVKDRQRCHLRHLTLMLENASCSSNRRPPEKGRLFLLLPQHWGDPPWYSQRHSHNLLRIKDDLRPIAPRGGLQGQEIRWPFQPVNGGSTIKSQTRPTFSSESLRDEQEASCGSSLRSRFHLCLHRKRTDLQLALSLAASVMAVCKEFVSTIDLYACLLTIFA